MLQLSVGSSGMTYAGSARSMVTGLSSCLPHSHQALWRTKEPELYRIGSWSTFEVVYWVTFYICRETFWYLCTLSLKCCLLSYIISDLVWQKPVLSWFCEVISSFTNHISGDASKNYSLCNNSFIWKKTFSLMLGVLLFRHSMELSVFILLLFSKFSKSYCSSSDSES